jgi:hypothetical protein
MGPDPLLPSSHRYPLLEDICPLGRFCLHGTFPLVTRILKSVLGLPGHPLLLTHPVSYFLTPSQLLPMWPVLPPVEKQLFI